MKDVKIFASCHNHSCYSDALLTPEELAVIAHKLGHGGIILTDHDTVRGTYFLNKAARKLGLKSILGCEFTTYHKGVSVHVLGFDFNPDNARMRDLMKYASGVQSSRSEVLFNMGIERGTLRDGCTWSDVLDDFPYNDYFCNNQVFSAMTRRGIYKKEEYPSFFNENFSYGLGLEDSVYEITKKSYRDISTEHAVKTILAAGGVPIVAHPHELEKFVRDFIDMGVLGFETRHPELTGEGEHEFYEQLCNELNLYKMGGSDHYGDLGGFLDYGTRYIAPLYLSGVTEEDFLKLYERKFG